MTPRFITVLCLLVSIFLLSSCCVTAQHEPTAFVRILFASPTVYETDDTISVAIFTQVFLSDISYGEVTMFFPFPAERTISLNFYTEHHDITPVKIELREDAYYTAILFDSPSDDGFKGQYGWHSLVVSDSPASHLGSKLGDYNPKLAIGVLDHSIFPSDDDVNKLNRDASIYRMVNLIPKEYVFPQTIGGGLDHTSKDNHIPHSLFDDSSLQDDMYTYALLYLHTQCLDCNYCIFSSELSHGSYMNHEYSPYDAFASSFFFPSQDVSLSDSLSHQSLSSQSQYLNSPSFSGDLNNSQIQLFTIQEVFHIKLSVGVVRAVKDDYEPKPDELIIYSCSFPSNSQRYMAKKSLVNLKNAVVVNDPLHEHQVSTIFITPPPFLRDGEKPIQQIDVNKILLHQVFEREGRFIYTPLLFSSLLCLLLFVIVIGGIIRYQRRQSSKELKRIAEQQYQQQILQQQQQQQQTVLPGQVHPGTSAQQQQQHHHHHHQNTQTGSPIQQQHHLSLLNPTTNTSLPPPISPSNAQQQKQQKNSQLSRVSSLDVFRGLVICAMAFCNFGAGGYILLEHATWDGYYFADGIFPAFVFIMGVSNTLSSRVEDTQTKWQRFKTITIRALKLFLIGIFLANPARYKTFRFLGVLQRFGLAYFAISLLGFLPLYDVDSKRKNTGASNGDDAKQTLLSPYATGDISMSFFNSTNISNYTPYTTVNGSYAPSVAESDNTETPQVPIHLQTGKQLVWSLIKSSFSFIRLEFSRYRYQWMVMTLMVLLWAIIFLFVPAAGCPRGYAGPGGPFVENGAYANVFYRGQRFMCTGGISGYIDRILLTAQHTFQNPTVKPIFKTENHEPEGVLGTFTTIFCAFLGMVIGRVLALTKATMPAETTSQQGTGGHSSSLPYRILHFQRMTTWVLWGMIFILVTFIIGSHGYPFVATAKHYPGSWRPFAINKNLWTLPFVTLSVAMCTLMFTCVYFFVDFLSNFFFAREEVTTQTLIWSFFSPLIFVGQNSLLLFVLPNILASRFPFVWTVYGPSSHLEAILQAFHATLWVVIIATYCFYNKFFWKV